MLNEESSNIDIDSILDNPSDEYGFEVESWDDDETTVQESIPNTIYDGKSMEQIDNAAGDLGLSIMSGIAEYGVKPIVDAVTALSYGATKKITTGEFETPTAKEMEEDVTVLPKSAVHYEPSTTLGAIAKPVSGAVYGYYGTSGVLGAAGLTGKAGIITNATLKGITKSKQGLAVGKALAPLINGIAANGLAFWEDEANIFNLLQPHVSNPIAKSIVDFMALEGDDKYEERVMKQALAGGFVAAAAEGLGATFKGLKTAYKYMKGKKAITSANPQELASQLTKATEVAQTAKPGAVEKIVEDTPVQQVVKEVKETSKKLGMEISDIGVPRHPEKINLQAAKEKVAEALSEYIDIDNVDDMKKFADFIQSSDKGVEEIYGLLKLQKDTTVGGWMKIKALGKNALNNGAELNNTEKTNAVAEYLSNLAKSFGQTEDGLYKHAVPMNVASKDIIHKTNKRLFQEIENNADELASPKLFDILNSAETETEVVAKVRTFLGMADSVMTKKGFDLNKWVALEQAGLMTSPDTLVRNAYTSVENLTLGIADDITESLLNKISTDAVRYGGNARDFVDVYAKGAAYANYLKDSAIWGLQMSKKALNKIATRQPQNWPISPWRKYRQTLPRKLTTNLPSELGHTFSNDGALGRMANGWIKISGVGISESTDSFFDAGFFRGSVGARVNSQGRRLKKLYNLSDETVNRMQDIMYKNITDVDSTRRAYDIAEINEAIMAGIEKSVSRKASEDAAVMTFRAGQGAFTKGLTEGINKIPGLKLFIPFVKTSSTIVFDRFIHDRTPVGLLYEGGKSILGYLSPNIKSQLTNPMLRNKFLAKQAVGASLMTLGAYWYATGKITGDYSPDPEVRAAQKASGWQPNSYVTKNKDGSLSFTSLNNMGVASLLLKFPAKIAGYYNDYMHKITKTEKINEAETTFLSNAFGASLMLGAAITEETALRNVADIFDRLNRGFRDSKEVKNFFIDVATNPVVNTIPRVLRKMFANKDYEEIVENNMQGLASTINEMQIKHDEFGDPTERADFTSGLIGLSVKKLPVEERYKGIMAKYKMSVPGVSRVEYPTEKHSVRLDDKQMDDVRVKMKEFGVGEAIKAIVETIPDNPSQAVIDKYQEMINRQYNSIKKRAVQYLVLPGNELNDNYQKRIDFDTKEKYNVNKPAEVVPSLANF